jgi:hypothetical protein
MATDIYMTPLIITRHDKLKDELNFNQLAHCRWFVTRRLIRTQEFFFESLSITPQLWVMKDDDEELTNAKAEKGSYSSCCWSRFASKSSQNAGI